MLFLGSIAILFGGGQIPHANLLISEIIKLILAETNSIIYGINHSYSGLVEERYYELMNVEKTRQIRQQIGTYLATCRKFFPAADENCGRIIELFKKYDIHTLIVCGGDGSAKGLYSLHKKFQEANYSVRIIFIPCTIDGMNGTETIGIKATVAESVRRVKLVAANAFATFDTGFIGPRVAIIETQGRNRDDILLGTFKKLKKDGNIGRFKLTDIKLIVIPTFSNWSILKLLSKVENTNKPVLIIVSEGAKPIEKWFDGFQGEGIASKLTNFINSNAIRKANYDRVGYLSQSNDLISVDQINEVEEWAQYAVNYLLCSINQNDYATAIIKKDGVYKKMQLEELVKLNPNSEDAVPFTPKDLEKLKKYMM